MDGPATFFWGCINNAPLSSAGGGVVVGGGVVEPPPLIIGRYTLFAPACGTAGAARRRFVGSAAQMIAKSADSNTAIRVERPGKMLDMQNPPVANARTKVYAHMKHF
jgi:hypothetical protein